MRCWLPLVICLQQPQWWYQAQACSTHQMNPSHQSQIQRSKNRLM
jgi:hypothetical protein